MDDYISRDDARRALMERFANDQTAIGALYAVPAAYVRPVKEGYWQEGEFKYLTCSVCGCDTNLYDQHGFPIGQRKGHPYPCFCPHCGADMTGGADNG